MYQTKIRFTIPVGAADDVRSALELAGAPASEAVLSARYFDTPDRYLQQCGASICLHREAGQWMQSLSVGADNLLSCHRFTMPVAEAEFELVALSERDRTSTVADLLGRRSCPDLKPRFEWIVERARTVVNARSAGERCALELSIDSGEIRIGQGHYPVMTLGFDLLEGSPIPMLQLASRWQQRFSLICQAGAVPTESWYRRRKTILKARRPRLVSLSRTVSVQDGVFGMFDECLKHLSANLAALAQGLGNHEHKRQSRLSIVRLRSLLAIWATT